jgi:hypothetical protein
MARGRKLYLAVAWLGSWALIFVFASSLPGWLAIALAVATFAAFLLFSREPSACLSPGGSGCAPQPADRRDEPGAGESP